MKVIGRILSVILTMCIVLSSGAVLAKSPEIVNVPAQDIIDDIFRFDDGSFLGDKNVSGEDDPDIKRIEFLNAIGVWDDAEKAKDSLVTMTEFYIIMAKLKLGKDNPLEGIYAYEENADSKNATYRDVYTYLVDMLGYKHRCAQYGEGDKGVLVVAADIGLIKSNPENIDAFVTRGELAKYIAKALTIDLCIMEYTSTGGYKYTVADSKNLLNTVHNIYDKSGFVNAVPGLAIYGGSSLKEGYIQIERTNINANGFDVAGYLGTRVDAYVYYDEEINEYSLVYIAPSADNKMLEIDFSQIVSVKNNEITYVDGENRELEVSVDNFSHIVQNGQQLASLGDMCDFKTNDGKITLAASKKKGEYDTAIIYKYNYYVVDYNEKLQNRIGLKFSQLHNGLGYIQMDEKAVNVVTEDGVPIKYTDISPNSAIRIMECESTGYKEIFASRKVVAGEITALYDNNIEVEGEFYKLSADLLRHIDYCETNTNLSYNDKVRMPQLGDVVTLYISSDGVVAGFTTSGGYKLAILKNASTSRSSIDPEMTLRLFNEDGVWLDLTFADKIILDGQPGVPKSDVIDKIKSNASVIIGELLRYKTNASDKIIALDTIEESIYEIESTDDVECVDDLDVKVNWTKWDINGSNYMFGTSAVVFVVPENADKEKDYKAVTPSALAQDQTYGMRLYCPDEFLHVTAVLLVGSVESGSSEVLSFMHIENIRSVVLDKENDEFGYKISGKQYVNQRAKGKGTCTEVSFYVEKEKYDSALESGEGFVVGDFMRINVSGANLESWAVDIPGGKITMAPGISSYGSFNNNSYYLWVGKVVKVDAVEGLVLVNCGTDEEPLLKVCAPRAKGIIDLSTNKTINATAADYHTGDYVYINTAGGHANLIIKNIN